MTSLRCCARTLSTRVHRTIQHRIDGCEIIKEYSYVKSHGSGALERLTKSLWLYRSNRAKDFWPPIRHLILWNIHSPSSDGQLVSRINWDSVPSDAVSQVRLIDRLNNCLYHKTLQSVAANFIRFGLSIGILLFKLKHDAHTHSPIRFFTRNSQPRTHKRLA